MKKLHRIFNVLLTAAIMASLLITSVMPVSAGTHEWTQFATPSEEGLVMPNNIYDSGLLTMGADGALYAYVRFGEETNNVVLLDWGYNLVKSTNGGRTWTATEVPGEITAIAASPTEANVIYIAVNVENTPPPSSTPPPSTTPFAGQGTTTATPMTAGYTPTIMKSTDGGKNFTTMASLNSYEFITAMAVAKVGGAYKVIVGTSYGGATSKKMSATPYELSGGNVYIMDEAEFFNTLVPVGTPDFATANPGARIIDIELSPSFATDRGVVVLSTDDNIYNSYKLGDSYTAALISYNVGGGSWGATPGVEITLAESNERSYIAYDIFGQLALPTGFSISNPSYYVGVGAYGGDGGVYRVMNGAAVLISEPMPVGSLDVTGSFTSASLIAGTAYGEVYTTLNYGQVWTQGKKLTGDGPAEVLFRGDFASSGVAYALTTPRMEGSPYDEAGFHLSVDKGVNWNGLSLLNSTIYTIDDVAFAANGDIFMITSSVAPDQSHRMGEIQNYDNRSLWRYSGGNWERVLGNQEPNYLTKLELSPNYASDGGVFFIDGTDNGTTGGVIVGSTDRGQTFEAQVVPPFAGSPVCSYEVINLNTFVVGTTDGRFARTTNGGFFWDVTNITEMTGYIAAIIRSTDGSTLAAIDDNGRVTRSTDLGVTWSASPEAALPGAAAPVSITFEYGSNSKIWATSYNSGVFAMNLTAATPSWGDRFDDGGDAPLFDSPNSVPNTVDQGVGIASGIAVGGDYVIYAMDADAELSRIMADASRAGKISPSDDFTGANKLYIQPQAGANKLWTIGDGNELYTYTDHLAVPVPGVSIGAFNTGSATVTWTGLPTADTYGVAIVAGSEAASDVYTAVLAADDLDTLTYTFNNLDSNTVYSVSVWAVAPVTSFVGTTSFATQPNAPGQTDPNLAPPPAAQDVPTNPSFQWSPIPGATGYVVEVGTDSGFTNPQRFSSPIAAFAWPGSPLNNGAVYYWRVAAQTATGQSAWVSGVFTTAAAAQPQVTVTQTAQPGITLTQLGAPDAEVPTYIWLIIGIGGILTILVTVLIVRTRAVV
ncbi:MAG: hypothetical protein P3T54_02785 [Dehalogenimonas sp.]|uniref:Fibronectin type-III domain-containing protein n=1 Tax=Candidatus Dehalogenimonas loeffleri TaxID=3127115 RepID=A0ABZ2JC36_9CHLR|nr:hypothetical protein [Dehalogenimonas sp.]